MIINYVPLTEEVLDMLRVASGKFKVGRGFDFINYFRNEDNIRKIQASLPEGVEFIDAYIVDRGADHHWEIVYKMPRYAVLDEWNLANEKFKNSFEDFIREMGFYADSFEEKFLKTVREATPMSKNLFDEVMANEKERSS